MSPRPSEREIREGRELGIDVEGDYEAEAAAMPRRRPLVDDWRHTGLRPALGKWCHDDKHERCFDWQCSCDCHQDDP